MPWGSRGPYGKHPGKSEVAYRRQRTAEQLEARKQKAAKYRASEKGIQSRHDYEDSRYGLAPGERVRIEQEQGGLCAICGRPPKTIRLAVDHCHRCDEVDKRLSVRGLLCVRCNRGYFGEEPELLRRAADYFAEHVCTPKRRRIKKAA